MSQIIISIQDEKDIRLLYASIKFKEGREVTGYLIYPDFTLSDIIMFTEVGLGIYGARILYERQTPYLTEKHGIVILENGVSKHLAFLQIIN